MPRRPRNPNASPRTSSPRDVPGALYCDPDYGAAVEDNPAPWCAAGEDGDAEGAADEGGVAPGDDADGGEGVAAHPLPPGASPEEIAALVRDWVPVARRRQGRDRVRGRPAVLPASAITEALRDGRGSYQRAARILGYPYRGTIRGRVMDHPDLWPDDTPHASEVVGRSGVPAAEVLAAWRRTGSATRTAADVGLHRSTVWRWLVRKGLLAAPRATAEPPPGTPPEG